MYTLRIIPIAKGLPENFFTYFHNEKISLGALVKIKIRNRKVLGIVSAREEVIDKKVNIKSAKFILKKIEKVILNDFLKEELFKSISNTSALIGVKESDILENYLSEFIFENLNILENKNEKIQNVKDGEKYTNNKTFIENYEKRFNFYKENIKNNFKNKKSTVIFFPTINDLEFAKNNFEKDFNNENIICFHSGQNKKELKENLNKLKEEKNFLILSTPTLAPFLLKDKINLKTIILEKENSFNYFTHTSKKQIDAREVIKNLTKDLYLELISAGNILSLNTFKNHKDKIEEKEIRDKNRVKNFEIISLAKDKIEKEEIKTRTKIIKEKENTKYSPVYFSDKLIDKLENIKNKNSKVFLFAKRKGLYTETVCADCNTIFKCEDCDKPYILFKDKKSGLTPPLSKGEGENANTDRLYICTNCKNKIELKKSENLTCKNCGSWRMNTLGVATQGIEENLKEVGWNTFILDSNNVKTKKDILKILEAWQKESSASVLIGTDLALNFLNKDFICDLGAVISLDSLFGVPEINIDEKIFNICLEMYERIQAPQPPKGEQTQKELNRIIIQTRLPEQSVWEYIKENDVIGFLENELETRKMLSLPPYSNILKWTLGKRDIKMKGNIEKILEKIFEEEIRSIPNNSIQPIPNPSQREGLTPMYHTANTKNYAALKMQSEDLRKRQTLAEEILWKELKGNKLEEHFRRQHIISGFIVDFICLSKNLIIELDGEIHNIQKERDEERENILKSFNFKILRLKNKEVIENLTKVLQIIKLELDKIEGKVLPLGEDLGGAVFEKPTITWKIEKKTGNYIGNMIIKKEYWEKEEIMQNKKVAEIIPTTFAKKITALLSDFKLEIRQ